MRTLGFLLILSLIALGLCSSEPSEEKVEVVLPKQVTVASGEEGSLIRQELDGLTLLLNRRLSRNGDNWNFQGEITSAILDRRDRKISQSERIFLNQELEEEEFTELTESGSTIFECDVDDEQKGQYPKKITNCIIEHVSSDANSKSKRVFKTLATLRTKLK